MAIGVYRISNAINGKMYIGSTTVAFERRWQQHRNLLLEGKHGSRHLQAAWLKYGAEQFAFQILEELQDPYQVLVREQAWIDQYWSSGLLYNSSPTAGSTRGFRFSQEARERIGQANRSFYRTEEGREIQRERARKFFSTPEGRQAHSEGQRRRFASPEAREIRSLEARERTARPEVKANMAAAQRARLKDPTTRAAFEERNRAVASDPACRAKLSLSQRTKDEYGNPVVYNLIAPDDTIYRNIENLSAFCREHGLNTSSVCAVLRGKLHKTAGWRRYVKPEDL